MRLARLDGIRAIAVIMVIVYHHALLSSTGWLGVDLFFVLSGYLITRILRGTRTSASYWGQFYTKRAARLIPALLLTLVFVALVARRLPLLGYVGYVAFLGDVIDVTRLQIALLIPLWSLAVEEHFYLVWPSFVRTCSRRNLVLIIVGTLLLEPILRLIVTPRLGANQTLHIYYLTPFRLDSIAFGSLLALLSEDQRASERLRRIAGPCAIISSALYFILLFLVPSFEKEARSLLFNSLGYSIIALAFFFITAWVVSLSDESLANRLLSWRPLVYVGRISYGMYLFQQIVLTVTRKAFHVPFNVHGVVATQRLLPLDLALTIACAALSFHLFEYPVSRWAARWLKQRERAQPEELLAAAGDLSAQES